MNKFFKIIIVFVLLRAAALAQPVYLAADSLSGGDWMHGAYAVRRLNHARLEVQPSGKSTLKVRQITTILDPLGDEHAQVAVRYSKNIKIDNIEVNVYNRHGRKIYSSNGKNDINDHGSYDGITLATDEREKRWFQKSSEYPYSVEVVYSQVYQNIFFLPVWFMGAEYSLPLQHAVFELSTAIPMRVKGYGPLTDGLPQGEEWLTSGSWALAQQPALERVPLSLPARYTYTLLRFAPEHFLVDDVPGSFRDWPSLGRFYAALNQSLDVLPPAEQATVLALTDTCTTDLSRVRVLYRWVQQSTRYVSVQLGVGGFRTFDARYVAQNGYGDCKALTNYMQAVLKVVHIQSFPSLVYSGNVPDIDCGFPSFQFNHVILCVPLGQDSLWLECTADALPAGYPGDFTGGRHVLLATSEGGNLCLTPADAPENHLVTQRFSVTVEPGAAPVAQLRATLSGDAAAEREMARIAFSAQELDRQKLGQLSRYSIAIDSDTWNYVNYNNMPEGIYTAQLQVPNILTPAGSRQLINTGYFAPEWPVRNASLASSQPIYLKETLNRTDSILFRLPAAWMAEAPPKAVTLACAAGRYTASFQQLPSGEILIVKQYLLLKGSYPDLESDRAVRTFLLAVAKADKAVWICRTAP